MFSTRGAVCSQHSRHVMASAAGRGVLATRIVILADTVACVVLVALGVPRGLCSLRIHFESNQPVCEGPARLLFGCGSALMCSRLIRGLLCSLSRFETDAHSQFPLGGLSRVVPDTCLYLRGQSFRVRRPLNCGVTCATSLVQTGTT